MDFVFKRAVRQVTPPFLWSGVTRVLEGIAPRAEPAEDQLFGSHDALFKEAVSGARVYFEYGVGQSTLWMDRESDAKIVSVDTSREWIDKVQPQLVRGDHSIIHIELGPLGNWGKPVGFSHRHRFLDYVEAPWQSGLSPDVVLIDGRFRISSFLTSLLHAQPGCLIVFDDYGRPAYHVVEEYLGPVKSNARQALFEVPSSIERDAILEARDQFLFVRD